MGGGSYSSAEVQSVYSTAPADWARSGLDYFPAVLAAIWA